MDKNQSIGLILISVMLLGYLYFFSETPQPPIENNEQTIQVDTIINQEAKASDSETEYPVSSDESMTASSMEDSLNNAQEIEKWGAFYDLVSKGDNKTVAISNDLLEIELSEKGGKVEKVILRKHQSYDKTPLVLVDAGNSQMSWTVMSSKGPIDLYALHYKSKILFESPDSTAVQFMASNEKGSINQTYTIKKGSHIIDHKFDISGFEGLIIDDKVQFNWEEKAHRFENVLEQSRTHTAVNYFTINGDFEDVTNDASPERETGNAEAPIKWMSMKQKFFNVGIITNSIPFSTGQFSSQFDPEDSSVVKEQTIEAEIPLAAFKSGESFKWFYGPNNFSILKKVTEGYGDNVYLGWTVFATVNKYTVVPFFNFLENYISNYGLIIMILVFIVKLILSPLSYKSYVSMAKMKVLKPEIEDIKKRLGDDQQKVQVETMALYQKFGVNPLSGCVPMVLQIPVLFALFNFFPNSVELRQKSFLWADDLSTYDNVLDLPFTIPFYGDHVSMFTLLMTLSTLAYTFVQNKNNPMQQQGPMKTLQYFFPVTIMFFLNNFSAGLTFYYFVSNVITIAQQLIIAKFIDDKAIRNKLETNQIKRKDKKKTGFSARLEEAMKAQQNKQQKKGSGKKGK